jgi:hypothetical protein
MTKAEREENKRIGERAKHLRELLLEFGAVLCGFDPGVTADIKGMPRGFPGCGGGYWGEHLAFDGVAWRWLEPLLIELRNLRKQKFQMSRKVMR